MRKIFVLLIALGCTLNGMAQEISFFKENITMKLEREYFYVSGKYYYRSDSPAMMPLFYPYPQDPLYGRSDSLIIFDITNNSSITALDEDSLGARFDIAIQEEPELLIQVSYRQKLLGNKAEYIITTTQLWQQPMEQAYYQLIVPNDISITHFSISPNDSIVTELERVYTWEKFNFMPRKNLVFEFEEVGR